MKLKLLAILCALFCVNGSFAQKTTNLYAYWDYLETNVRQIRPVLGDGETAHGTEKYFYSNGKLESAKVYNRGVPSSYKCYFLDGSIEVDEKWGYNKEHEYLYLLGACKAYKMDRGIRYLSNECNGVGRSKYSYVKAYSAPNVLDFHYRANSDGSEHVTSYYKNGKVKIDAKIANKIIVHYTEYDSEGNPIIIIKNGITELYYNSENGNQYDYITISEVDSLRKKYVMYNKNSFPWEGGAPTVLLEMEYIATPIYSSQIILEATGNTSIPSKYYLTGLGDQFEIRRNNLIQFDGNYKTVKRGGETKEAYYSKNKLVWSKLYSDQGKLEQSVELALDETIDGQFRTNLLLEKKYENDVLKSANYFIEKDSLRKPWNESEPEVLRIIYYEDGNTSKTHQVVEYISSQTFRNKRYNRLQSWTDYNKDTKLQYRLVTYNSNTQKFELVYFEQYDNQGAIINGTDLQSEIDALIGERNKQEKKFLDFGSATSKNIYILSGMPEEEFTSTQIKGKNKNILLALQRVYAELLFNIEAHVNYLEQEFKPIITNGNMVDKIAVLTQDADRFRTLNNQVKRINLITERLKEVVNDPKKSRDLNKELKDCTLQTANEIFAKL